MPVLKRSLSLSEIIKRKPVPTEVKNKVISHSQFSTYKGCPHAWRLRYINKIKLFTGSINSVFGTSMHEVLQAYLDVLYTDTVKKADAMDLDGLLLDRFRDNYSKEVEKNNGVDFSNAEEMGEFYNDGIAILRWFKTHRAQFFSIKGYELLGIEIPIMMPTDANPNVFINGYLDIVLYDRDEDRIIIYDIKTSIRGWKDDKEKKDKTKIAQILWYKTYFAKQYEIDITSIDVVFFIVKRKIWEEAEWPQPRVQIFRPAAGPGKINEANFSMQKFVQECFTDEGEYNMEREYEKNPGKSCTYCPFRNDLSLCDQKQSA